MLDIRVIAKLCEKKDIKLRCLGFNDDPNRTRADEVEIRISANEVSNIIQEDSVIRFDNFDELRKRESVAFQYVRKYGPFDVVNLDFCTSVLRRKDKSYLESLFHLCEYQINRRREPWLLFITTLSDYKSVSTDHFPGFWVNIKHNLTTSATFKKGIEQLVGVQQGTKSELELHHDLLEKMPNNQFSPLFGVGIGKWLIRIMATAELKWQVETLNSYWYRTEWATEPNMLSIAFLFIPCAEALTDPSGLVTGPAKQQFNESSLAMQLLKEMTDLCDLDRELHNNNGLFQTMIQETGKLLVDARYDIEEYDAWARGKTQVLAKKCRF